MRLAAMTDLADGDVLSQLFNFSSIGHMTPNIFHRFILKEMQDN